MATGSVRSKKIEKPASAKVDVNPKVGHRPAKGHHAAESVYAKGQCKSGVLYKPGSPCGRKLMKEALGNQQPLHGEHISNVVPKSAREVENQNIGESLVALRAEIMGSKKAVMAATDKLNAEVKSGGRITGGLRYEPGQREKDPLQLNPYVRSMLSQHLKTLDARTDPTEKEKQLRGEVIGLLEQNEKVEQSKGDYGMAVMKAKMGHMK